MQLFSFCFIAPTTCSISFFFQYCQVSVVLMFEIRGKFFFPPARIDIYIYFLIINDFPTLFSALLQNVFQSLNIIILLQLCETRILLIIYTKWKWFPWNIFFSDVCIANCSYFCYYCVWNTVFQSVAYSGKSEMATIMLWVTTDQFEPKM